MLSFFMVEVIFISNFFLMRECGIRNLPKINIYFETVLKKVVKTEHVSGVPEFTRA